MTRKATQSVLFLLRWSLTVDHIVTEEHKRVVLELSSSNLISETTDLRKDTYRSFIEKRTHCLRFDIRVPIHRDARHQSGMGNPTQIDRKCFTGLENLPKHRAVG
jgi:hypothetical protein